MALFKVFEDGQERIVRQDSVQYTHRPKEHGFKTVSVTRIVYQHDHWMPPMLMEMGGKKYLMPTWTEVHPQTELSDIIWNKPEMEVKNTVIEREFFSKSDKSITYLTKREVLSTGKAQYSCNCPGRWRAKNRICKHMKVLMAEFGDTES